MEEVTTDNDGGSFYSKIPGEMIRTAYHDKPQVWNCHDLSCCHDLGCIHLSSSTVNSSPLDKMAAILADDNIKCTFLDANETLPIPISLKFATMWPIDNKSALVQVMAWRRTGDKPLAEPMLTQFTSAYMRHHWGGEGEGALWGELTVPTNPRGWPTCHYPICTDNIWLGSATMNYKN